MARLQLPGRAYWGGLSVAQTAYRDFAPDRQAYSAFRPIERVYGAFSATEPPTARLAHR
jgi:hypothetical protein